MCKGGWLTIGEPGGLALLLTRNNPSVSFADGGRERMQTAYSYLSFVVTDYNFMKNSRHSSAAMIKYPKRPSGKEFFYEF